ncbi:unnamed protein product [Closterium sp. NIES-54]
MVPPAAAPVATLLVFAFCCCCAVGAAVEPSCAATACAARSCSPRGLPPPAPTTAVPPPLPPHAPVSVASTLAAGLLQLYLPLLHCAARPSRVTRGSLSAPSPTTSLRFRLNRYFVRSPDFRRIWQLCSPSIKFCRQHFPLSSRHCQRPLSVSPPPAALRLPPPARAIRTSHPARRTSRVASHRSYFLLRSRRAAARVFATALAVRAPCRHICRSGSLVDWEHRYRSVPSALLSPLTSCYSHPAHRSLPFSLPFLPLFFPSSPSSSPTPSPAPLPRSDRADRDSGGVGAQPDGAEPDLGGGEGVQHVVRPLVQRHGPGHQLVSAAIPLPLGDHGAAQSGRAIHPRGRHPAAGAADTVSPLPSSLSLPSPLTFDLPTPSSPAAMLTSFLPLPPPPFRAPRRRVRLSYDARSSFTLAASRVRSHGLTYLRATTCHGPYILPLRPSHIPGSLPPAPPLLPCATARWITIFSRGPSLTTSPSSPRLPTCTLLLPSLHAIVPPCRRAAMLLCRHAAVSPCCCVAMLLCRHAAVSPYHRAAMPSCRHAAVSCCIAVRLARCCVGAQSRVTAPLVQSMLTAVTVAVPRAHATQHTHALVAPRSPHFLRPASRPSSSSTLASPRLASPRPSRLASLCPTGCCKSLSGNQHNGSIPMGISRLVNLRFLYASPRPSSPFLALPRPSPPLAPRPSALAPCLSPFALTSLSLAPPFPLHAQPFSPPLPAPRSPPLPAPSRSFPLLPAPLRMSLASNCSADYGYPYLGNTTNVALNSLNGSLPDSLFSLSNLQLLMLGRNQLTGVLPASIGGLKALKALCVPLPPLPSRFSPLPSSLSPLASRLCPVAHGAWSASQGCGLWSVGGLAVGWVWVWSGSWDMEAGRLDGVPLLHPNLLPFSSVHHPLVSSPPFLSLSSPTFLSIATHRRYRGVVFTGTTPALPSGTYSNKYFRHLSNGFTGNYSSPTWNLTNAVDWRAILPSPLLPAKDQGLCSSCWAFAPVAATEALYAITYGAAAPNVSEQRVVDCQGQWSCAGGYPAHAFNYIASSGGLPLAVNYPYTGIYSPSSCRTVSRRSTKRNVRFLLSLDDPLLPTQPQVHAQAEPAAARRLSTSAQPAAHRSGTRGVVVTRARFSETQMSTGPFSIASYEQVSVPGWMGMALAVQQQPVVAYVEADQESFISYAGVVNHAVVIVGYDLLAAPPLWLVRNSWGSGWGDQGYMQLAIAGGSGVCGVNTMPAIYPTILGPDPCGPINPCGGGTCKAAVGAISKKQANTCTCPDNFIPVINIDKTQTCAPAKVCVFYAMNPCGFGTCVDNDVGGYSCLCSAGFTQGMRTDATITCIPATKATSTVSLPTAMTCDQVRSTYSLSMSTFRLLNPKLKCPGIYKAGTTITVRPAGSSASLSSITGCTVPLTISQGDTCEWVLSMFGITAADLAALNPDLNCTQLVPGQQLCMDQGTPLPLSCTSYYTVNPGETCNDVMAKAQPPITALQLYSYNPGVICSADSSQRLVGLQLCVGSLPLIGASCYYGTYTVVRGDTCATVVCKIFKCSYSLMYYYNPGFTCTTSTLWVGRVLCKPKP